MAKKFLAFVLAAMLLAFMVSCDDDNLSGGVEIDVSGDGFFGDPVDTTDTATVDTTENADGTAEDTGSDTAEAAE